MSELESNTAGRWAIRHESSYRYSVAVTFAPHVLRLTPRPERVRCLERTIAITPTPIEQADFDDAFGNRCTRVTFGAGQSSELTIENRLVIESLPAKARDPGASLPMLPWATPANDSLAAFRQRDNSAEVTDLARRLALEVESAPLPFFGRLNSTLHSTLDRQIRIEGPAQSAAETLRLGGGACRDLTVLFLAVCRSLGVAARFVSGYQGQEASPDGKRHLHAWPEVFVPELGWLGWDPTHGVPVGSGHVALAAAPEQAATMPIEGGFYFSGSKVTSTLGYSISFEPL